MARPLPPLSDPQPTSTIQAHGQIRGWLEYVTSSNPYVQVDWGVYQTVLDWTGRDDYRRIVEEVLKRRLASDGVSAYKAVILAQALPITSLVNLLGDLQPHTKPKDGAPLTQLNAIASSLSERAAAHKAEEEATKTEEEAKTAWETWCGVYGRPMGAHSWRGLPPEVEWGNWGLVWVPAQEWWMAKEQDKG